MIGLPRRAFLLVALALFSATLHGRQSDQYFPGPMTSADIASLLSTLRASSDQQEAMLRQHEVYLEEFKRLRSEILDEAVRRIAIINRPVMPDPIDARQATQMVMRGRMRIESLDNEFFTETAAMLSPAQEPLLDHARRSRERIRSLHVLRGGMVPHFVAVDLARLLTTFGIAPDEELFPDLYVLFEQHEAQLTRVLTDMSREAGGMLFSVILDLERAGVAPGTDLSTEEAITELMPIIEGALGRTTRRLTQSILEIDRSTRSTVQSMSDVLAAHPQLGPERLPGHVLANRLRRAVPAERHHEIGMSIYRHNQYAEFLFHAEAWAHTLDAETRDRLLAIIEREGRQIDRIAHEMVEVLESRVERFTVTVANDDIHERSEERLQALRLAARQHNGAIITAMGSETGNEWARALDQRLQNPRRALDLHDPDDPARAPEDWTWSGDWALPSPMGARDERRFRALLTMNRDEAAVLHDLLDGQRFAIARIPERQRVRTRAEERPGVDFTTADEAEIRARALRNDRRRAMDEVHQIDQWVFSEVAGALADVQTGSLRGRMLEMLRYCREAEIFARRGMVWFVGREAGDTQLRFQHPFDLLLRERSLTDAQRIDAAFAAEELVQELPALARRMFDHALQVHSIADGWDPDVPPAISLAAERVQSAARPAAVMYEADLALEDLLERIVLAMTRELPDEAARSILNRFRRAQWPVIYDRVPDIAALIERARGLEDLTPQQREELEELLMSARIDLDETGEKATRVMRELVLLQIRRLSRAANPIDDDMNPEAFQLARTLNRLHEERPENARRALLRIRTILTDEQAARLDPLPSIDALAQP